MDSVSIILLFFVGLLAGFLNVMAGGGSALALPALIFLGLDGPLANGTNRVAIVFQNLSALRGFWQGDGAGYRQDFRDGFILALWTLPGALLGALMAVRIDDGRFRFILAIVMAGVVLTMFLPRPRGGERERAEEGQAVVGPRRYFLYICLLGVGFYGGFIQVGVGFLIMAALFHVGGLELTRVNMYKVLIIAVYTIPALTIFIINGKVVWAPALVLATGNSLGGYLASRLALKKGAGIIKPVMGLALLIMAGRLLWPYLSEVLSNVF